MIIGSISENKDIEKRVAITPEIVKKYKSLGLEVYLSKNYGVHLGINDKNYKKLILHKPNFLAISGYIWKNSELKPKEAAKKLIYEN